MEPYFRAQIARQVAHTAMRSSNSTENLAYVYLSQRIALVRWGKVDSGFLFADTSFKNGVWVGIDRSLSSGSSAVLISDTASV